MLGMSIFTESGAILGQSGLGVGLMDDELAELVETGRVRRTFGVTKMAASLNAGIIVQMLWEGRIERTTLQQSY